MQRLPLTLARLVERYRFAELEPVAELPEQAALEAVASSDESLTQAPGTLVLGIGIHDEHDASRELSRWAHAGATAVVLRADAVPLASELERIQAIHPIAVLTLGKEMPWLRFFALVVAELAGGPVTTPVESQWRGDSELFELADSIAALVDGPVTIEDLSSTILAFSSDQDRADGPRKLSILERRVSAVNNEILASEGVFDRLYASAQPVFLRTTVEGSRPRAAIRIKVGDELLGSIWAVVDGPLSPVQAKGMQDASNVVALAMLGRRLADEAHSQSRLSQVTRLIDGGVAAAEAALELGIGDAPAFVLTIRRGRSAANDPAARHAQRSLARTLSAFITSVNPQSAVAEVNDTIYAVVAVRRSTAEGSQWATDAARRFVEGLLFHVPRDGVTIGYGEVVGDITQLARSRRQADVAVRVAHTDAAASVVVAWEDVQVDGLLVELLDTMIARHESVAQPLARVIQAQERTGLVLLTTLAAYLEHFGDVTAAAAALFVHPNTFRYRLRKLEAEAGLSLKDHQTRFELYVQLRLLEHQERMRPRG